MAGVQKCKGGCCLASGEEKSGRKIQKPNGGGAVRWLRLRKKNMAGREKRKKMNVKGLPLACPLLPGLGENGSNLFFSCKTKNEKK